MNQPTTEWCVDRDLLEREECERACHAVFDVVLPRVQRAWIDAYSNEQHLPAEASAAQDALLQMGRARSKGDPGMSIDLDVRDAAQALILRTFAPW